jgi:hypothetical protein
VKPSVSVLLNPPVTALVFCGSVQAASSLLSAFWLQPETRLAVVLLPLPFFLLFALASLRSLRDFDHPQRRLLTEALIFAGAITLFAILGAELLQAVGSPVWRNQQAWPYLLLVGCLVGYWSAARRYR